MAWKDPRNNKTTDIQMSEPQEEKQNVSLDCCVRGQHSAGGQPEKDPCPMTQHKHPATKCTFGHGHTNLTSEYA